MEQNNVTKTLSEQISEVIDQQRGFFKDHRTFDYEYRVEYLRALRNSILRHETEILDALNADLGKSHFEGYATEVGLVLEELRSSIRKLKGWMRPRMAATPLVLFPATSWIYPEPLGLVLIISPWNYPFQLTMMPLIGAIAAGNCAVVKPSRYSRQTSLVMEKIIREVFPEGYVSYFHGGTEMNTALLEQRFDHIFFTGSPNVGRVVMTAAAKHLTPVTLELGGKSPCIVDRTADIELAAARVVWGKCVNAGQTCVGIDYLLVDEAIKTPFFEALGRQIKLMYSADPISNPEYPKIINQKQFDRLCGLMNGLEPLIGGRIDSEKMKIEPTVFADVTLDDAIMKEEIFGPLLPTFTYHNLDEALDLIRTFEKPLAFYVFSTDKPLIDRIIREMPFGGGCINDALIHLSNPNIPFGGVGESGLGSYHGKRSFDALTHYKSVIKKSAHIEVPLRLPPYRDNLKILRKLLK